MRTAGIKSCVGTNGVSALGPLSRPFCRGAGKEAVKPGPKVKHRTSFFMVKKGLKTGLTTGLKTRSYDLSLDLS